MTSAQNKRHGPLSRSGIAFIGLYHLDFIADILTDIYISGTDIEAVITDKFENFISSVEPTLDLAKIKM